MELKPIASNMTELILNDGTVVLFSYETPVASITPDGAHYRTEKKWSVTTSKHIGKWYKFRSYDVNRMSTKEQDYFDNLVKASKMTLYEYASIAALLWAIAGIIIVMKPWNLD